MIYFNHTNPKNKKQTFREMKFVNEDSRKYNRLIMASLGCLLVIAILNIAIFIYLTNKNTIANTISQSTDKMEAEIVVIQGQIHKSESITRISNDAVLAGLSKNNSVKVISIGTLNVGLKQ